MFTYLFVRGVGKRQDAPCYASKVCDARIFCMSFIEKCPPPTGSDLVGGQNVGQGGVGARVVGGGRTSVWYQDLVMCL